ncbi:MAG: DUF1772 domain-containing protein, partial [Saprospiraceae bacterium]|nr:DUF1772 domain-containing protein [Saprospiraceae bacterium]
GDYGLHEENFWMLVHPIAILTTILALILNWRLMSRRRLILLAFGIYILVILTTAVYFVPELIAFADSSNNKTVTADQWLQRGQTWQYFSWIRGGFMYVGFLSIMMALTKVDQERLPAKIPTSNNRSRGEN